MKHLFTFLLLVITAQTFAQESALLRLKYDKGDNYVMSMKMNQNMGGGAMIMDMNIEMPMKVTDVNDGVYSSEMSFKSVKMDMEQAGMKITYDSNAAEEDLDESAKMMSAQIKPMLETVIAIKTDAYGEVLEMNMVKGSGNINQFTGQVQSVVYPKETVTVGYSWTAEKDNGGMTIKSTYTVKSIDDKLVVLDVKGDISGSATGNSTGIMNIDKAHGIPLLSEMTMNFDISGQKVVAEVVMEMKKA